MKLKTGLWIIGIVLAFSIIGSFLLDKESTITSNVIKEEVPKEKIIQEETTPKEIVEIVIPEPTNDLHRVTRVIDGDTIEIEGGERVRLICIDTPERGEDGYYEAKDYLETLLLGREVELVKDVSEVDRYGRLLRYIFILDYDDIGDFFVNSGIARLGYGEVARFPPDTKYCDLIEKSQDLAKSYNKGIWEEIIEEPETTSLNSNIVCSYNAYNCEDFSSCLEVMEVFNTCNNDIHYLDGDDDGIPCESLCG